MTGPTSPGLELRGLTVRYGAQPAVQGVSLSVRLGEVVALAGPNGSGKSSLIRAVATGGRGAEGAMEVGGTPLAALPPLERARRVAWMPQEEATGDNVPLVDYVAYGRHPHVPRWSPPSDHDRSAVAEAIRTVDLVALADRGILELSGGERQRARLARALAQETPVLLLDEPTAHLDVGHQLEVLERVRAIAHRSSRSVLVALHDLNLAARFADRVAVLAHGRLRTEGPPGDVLSPELLAEVWGVVAELRRDATSGLPYLIPRLPAAPRSVATRLPRVHLVAGGGSGAGAMRAALERGWDVTAGVLPLFDSDSELARDLGVPAVVELPFAPIGDEALARLDGLLERADVIVVAPFPVGPTNLANLEHLAAWVPRRPTALVDPPAGARWDYAEGRALAARAKLLGLGATSVPTVDAALAWAARRFTAEASPALR